MIKGIDVIIYNKTKTGEDPFGNPIYDYCPEVVHGVLVAPGADNEILSVQDLKGAGVVYTLAIPKGDTHDWRDKKVEFFGESFVTYGIGTQGIEENIPLRWNKKVMVKRYE